MYFIVIITTIIKHFIRFYLGEIYRQTDRLDRTKACLFYALELESTTPIQPFSVLPRYI